MAAPSSTGTFHRSDNATLYRSNASFVYSTAYTSAVLSLLDPQPGEKILDVGCGTGELSRVIARMVGRTGRVVAIDLSAQMIDEARKAEAAEQSSRGEAEQDTAEIEWIVQDATKLEDLLARDASLVGSFDKVFSNAALHWMKASPSSVLRGVHRALKADGGVFAAEMGGFMNMLGVRGALHAALRRRGVKRPDSFDPWYFPTTEEYRSLIEGAHREPTGEADHPEKDSGGGGGPPFSVSQIELVPRMTPLPAPAGLRGWLRTFAGPFMEAFDGLEAEEAQRLREEVCEEVEETLRPDLYDAPADRWSCMYVRLRVRAVKGAVERAREEKEKRGVEGERAAGGGGSVTVQSDDR